MMKKKIALIIFFVFISCIICCLLFTGNKKIMQEKKQANINYDLKTVVNQYKQDVYLSFLDYIIEDVYGDADIITYNSFRKKQKYDVYIQEEVNILTFYFIYSNKNTIMCDEMKYDSKRNIYTTFLKTTSYNSQEEISEIFEEKNIHLIHTFNMELDNNYKLDVLNENGNRLFDHISEQINNFFLKNCEEGNYEIYIRYFSELDEYTYAAAYNSKNKSLYYLQLTFKDDIQNQNPDVSFPMACFEPERITENRIIDAYKKGSMAMYSYKIS